MNYNNFLNNDRDDEEIHRYEPEDDFDEDEEESENQSIRIYEKIGRFVPVTIQLFDRGRYLTPQAKWIYVTLRSFTNNQADRTFPSYNKIQERSGMTRPAVAKALRELDWFGWINKKKHFSKSTDYVVGFPPAKQNINGEGLEDQCSPTKAEAEEWKKMLRREKAEKEDRQDEEIRKQLEKYKTL